MGKVRICLDAGHYAKYNRSPAVKTYYESEMNWKLCGLLKAQLEKYGVEVVTTRPDPKKDLDLTSRGRKSAGCDLFLSIHSNAVGDGVSETVDYVVAYAQLDGRGDDLALTLAQTVAELMGTKQKPRVNHRKGNNGEYYGVLRGAAAVGTLGIILEHSFHTNTRATQWLLVEKNLEALAEAEAQVIATHFGATPPALAVEKWYRIRKSWGDAASQLAAYTDLALAKKNCPPGYTIYDWNGNDVYTTVETVTLDLPVLQTGDSGNVVKAMQQLLVANDYLCGPTQDDGEFGTNTAAAVKAWQSAHGIPATAICDVRTWASLLGA